MFVGVTRCGEDSTLIVSQRGPGRVYLAVLVILSELSSVGWLLWIALRCEQIVGEKGCIVSPLANYANSH